MDDVVFNADKRSLEYDYDMTKLKTQAHFTLVNKYEYVKKCWMYKFLTKICQWANFAPELPSSPDEFWGFFKHEVSHWSSKKLCQSNNSRRPKKCQSTRIVVKLPIVAMFLPLNQSRHERVRHRLGMAHAAWGGQPSNPPISKYFSEIVSPSHIKLTNNNPNLDFKSV